MTFSQLYLVLFLCIPVLVSILYWLSYFSTVYLCNDGVVDDDDDDEMEMLWLLIR